MKGAFELTLVIFFGMFFIVLGMSFVQIAMGYNQARVYQDYIITTIEHQNRYDDQIIELIQTKSSLCSKCIYSVDLVSEQPSVYEVKVQFPVNIPLINYASMGYAVSITQPIR